MYVFRNPAGCVYTNSPGSPLCFSAFTIGSIIQLMKYFARYTPINAPAPMAYSELIMRFRSSDRCSKNDICPPLSSNLDRMELAGWVLLVMGGGILGWASFNLWRFRRRFRGLRSHTFSVCCV